MSFRQHVANATVDRVASSATAIVLAIANPVRSHLMIFNDSAQPLYIKCGTGASTIDFTVKVLAGGYYEFMHPVYNGTVSGIWASADGAAQVTEGSDY